MTGLTVGTLCHFRPSLEDGFCIDSYFPFVSFFHSVKKKNIPGVVCVFALESRRFLWVDKVLFHIQIQFENRT